MLLFQSICRAFLRPWSLWDTGCCQVALATSNHDPRNAFLACYGFPTRTPALPASSCHARRHLSQATHLCLVISMLSMWGTRIDCKGHLMLCVWHVLAQEPTVASSPLPWGEQENSQTGWLLCGSDTMHCVKVVGGSSASLHRREITPYFHCNQDFWEQLLCLMWMQHHSALPALSSTHVHL